jgi:hypothetical protein
MATVSLATLLVQQTKAQLYTFALGIANAVGLPVSSWQAGDPTRAHFNVEAETMATLEEVIVGYIQSGFLDFATGIWLTILADQVYGVTVPPATFATTDVTITNQGGAYFPSNPPGSLTFKSTVSGKTFTNTTGGALASGVGQTLTVTVVADTAGSSSTAGVGEINALVTPLGSATCSNAVAAVGTDQQDDATTRALCRASLGPLSPNGPALAYGFVALTPSLTGTSGITRQRTYPNSTNGQVVQYLAGPGGAISAADLALAQAAILKLATPLCITPILSSAANVLIPLTYQLWVYKSSNKTESQIAADIVAALTKLLAGKPIGGDVIVPGSPGALYTSDVETALKAAVPQAFRVIIDSPVGDTALGQGQVAALGTVLRTITFVQDPT